MMHLTFKSILNAGQIDILPCWLHIIFELNDHFSIYGGPSLLTPDIIQLRG